MPSTPLDTLEKVRADKAIEEAVKLIGKLLDSKIWQVKNRFGDGYSCGTPSGIRAALNAYKKSGTDLNKTLDNVRGVLKEKAIESLMRRHPDTQAFYDLFLRDNQGLLLGLRAFKLRYLDKRLAKNGSHELSAGTVLRFKCRDQELWFDASHERTVFDLKCSIIRKYFMPDYVEEHGEDLLKKMTIMARSGDKLEDDRLAIEAVDANELPPYLMLGSRAYSENMLTPEQVAGVSDPLEAAGRAGGAGGDAGAHFSEDLSTIAEQESVVYGATAVKVGVLTNMSVTNTQANEKDAMVCFCFGYGVYVDVPLKKISDCSTVKELKAWLFQNYLSKGDVGQTVDLEEIYQFDNDLSNLVFIFDEKVLADTDELKVSSLADGDVIVTSVHDFNLYGDVGKRVALSIPRNV